MKKEGKMKCNKTEERKKERKKEKKRERKKEREREREKERKIFFDIGEYSSHCTL